MRNIKFPRWLKEKTGEKLDIPLFRSAGAQLDPVSAFDGWRPLWPK